MSVTTYTPLPNYLTIKKSNIDGLGIFTTMPCGKGTNFGISHVHNPDFQDGWIRTPLGGYINHSDNPNTIKHKDLVTNYYHLIAMRNIDEGEELTVKYTLYKIK